MRKNYFLFTVILFSNISIAQIINFPDPVFKAKLLTSDPAVNPVGFDQFDNYIVIDSNGDSDIDQSEALAVYRMQLSGSLNLSDVTGIEYFTNLNKLAIYGNSNLTSVDISNLSNLTELHINSSQSMSSVVLNTALETLELVNNALLSLDVTNCPNLTKLECNANQIFTLDLSNNTALQILNCSSNQLTVLDVSDLINLTNLNCSNNQIAVLETQNLSLLQQLNCLSNSLSELHVAGMAYLSSLNCDYNSITELDLTGTGSIGFMDGGFNLFFLNCSDNLLSTLDTSVMGPGVRISAFCDNNPNLTFLNCKNGVVYTDGLGGEPPVPGPGIYFFDCPNLQYVCTDEYNIDYIQNNIASYGYTQCVTNSYCSFVPGENYFVVEGHAAFDNDNNGCDASDPGFPGLKYTVDDGSDIRTFFFTPNGDYSVAALAGTHTITPVFENPGYFSSSPASAIITFPSTPTPATQDFCIIANGSHPDVEVVIVPLNAAVPGFDVYYNIIYKNNGNLAQSGTVDFTYNDAILDLVSANPVSSSATTNLMSWDFTDLLPFETRQINVVLNLNSPTETPPVTGGDVLSYNGQINIANDDNPTDNVFTLTQTVINSFDPNEKGCLEGDVVTSDMIGKYIHYVIRFENSGTANAQNIVLKDMIDTTKFDVSTLIPLSASHSFETRISSTKVAFIFENINLPFDDANNDGYVAFKIKTLPSLVVGDTFSNNASIYFDYNFPIVTNTATTTIEALGINDFEFSDYFTLFPNPAKDVLNIKSSSGMQISSISIYNILGRLMLTVANPVMGEGVDVSKLASGNYFIKVSTEKGLSVAKFIKQ